MKLRSNEARAVIVTAVVLVVCVAGQVLISLPRAKAANEAGGDFSPLWNLATILLWVTVGYFVIFPTFMILVRLRQRGMQERFPKAIVRASTKSPQLEKVLAKLEGEPFKIVKHDLNWAFCVVSDMQGFELWSSARMPGPTLRVRWAQVTEIFTTVVVRERSTAAGIGFVVEFDGGRVEFPLVFLGAGLFGVGTLRAQTLEEVRLSLEDQWRGSRGHT